MFGHDDEIEVVGVGGGDQFFERAGAVPAEAGVGVDYAFVLFEFGISCGSGAVPIQLFDLFSKLPDLVPPIDERRLDGYEHGQQNKQYPFEELLHLNTRFRVYSSLFPARLLAC